MSKKHFVFITSILVLIIFSSCGIIRIDTSVMKDQLTDFSPKEYPEGVNEDIDDCGCYGPKLPGSCTRIGYTVCGCDGVTSGNPCEAKMSGIYLYTRGKCQLSMNLIFVIESLLST